MRALVKTRAGPGLDLLQVPDPVPGPDEVVIRVEAAGVCGSDVARFVWTRNYDAGAAKAMTDDLPRIMGHEFAGVVDALGPDVTGVRVGDRVGVMNILGCGRCAACHRGMPNVCVERRTIGVLHLELETPAVHDDLDPSRTTRDDDRAACRRLVRCRRLATGRRLAT